MSLIIKIRITRRVLLISLIIKVLFVIKTRKEIQLWIQSINEDKTMRGGEWGGEGYDLVQLMEFMFSFIYHTYDIIFQKLNGLLGER